MRVKQAMHMGIKAMSPNDSIKDIAKQMQELDVGAIALSENDKIVGIITDRDIVVRGITKGKALSSLKARDVMSKNVTCCQEEQELDAAIRLMEDHQIRRLPVTDKNQKLVGMLSLGDVSHAAPNKLIGELATAVSAHH